MASGGRPRVSALVSAFKSERFLPGCLDDLERQTLADQLEIIVVNSNSPQAEHEIVSEYVECFDNIRYVRTPETESLYAAWNRAIMMASGDYLTTANTDDRHRRDAFEVMARTLDAHPEVALVYSGYETTYVENETFEDHVPAERFMPEEYVPALLLRGYCFPGPQPMWRRSVHAEVGLFDDRYHSAGDLDMWIRIAQRWPFMRVPEYLGLYLKSPESVEHRDAELSRRELAEVLGKYARGGLS
jgi:glycosyltransferase involved in cell wall biosynthesis